MRKIVLATIGTLGDLHPFIAIAIALKDRGFRPVLAVPADHVERVEGAGLEAVAILPGFAAISQRMGVSEDDAVQHVMADQRYMMEQVLFPELSSSAARLDEVAADAEAIVASIFVLAAPIIAEKHGIPLFPTLLQPMALLTPYDPPNTDEFWMMKHAPVGPVAWRWNKFVYSIFRIALNRVYGKKIDAVRAEQGLPREGASHMFEWGNKAIATLCCYSPHFAPKPADAGPDVELTGFAMFDGGNCVAPLDPELEAFLEAGPPPIVFTLGSFAVYAPGNFYAEAAQIARDLGKRAVLLTGVEPTVDAGPDIYACAYAPHSGLFPRSSIIVHHGGAGTTGQALRAGKAQLIVPHMGDQYDNAHRLAQLGLGHRLEAEHFTAARATPLIADLLQDTVRQARAEEIGKLVLAEDGAATAAAVIAERLG